MKTHKYILPDEITKNKAIKRLFNNQNKSSQATLALASLGLLILLVGTFTLPFNRGLFSQLFNKPSSHAMTMVMFPPNCGLTNPAFCDDFSVPHPGGRAGDLDDSKWSFYRLSEDQNPGQGVYNGFAYTDEQFCRTAISGILPDRDSYFCNANGEEEMHWMTAMNGGPYVFIGARIRQPFDFANRTGTIAFAVDAVTRGPHAWWPEVVISDQPINGAHTVHPAVDGTPQNGIALELSGACNQPNNLTDAQGITIGSIMVINNYAISTVNNTLSSQPCVKTLRDNANLFQMKISQNQIQIYSTNYDDPTTPILMATFPVNLNFTRGYVNFQEAAYSAFKFNGQQDMTYHWHHIGFDGPVLPTPRSYEVPDASTPMGDGQTLNVGYMVIDSNGTIDTCCTQKSLTNFPIQNVDLSNATSALLEFDTNGIGGGQNFQYRVNGNQWHTVTHPMAPVSVDGDTSDATSNAWFGYAVPVPINELQTGTNTIDFATSSGGPQYMIANIDLELNGDNITPTPEPLMQDSTPSVYMHVIPSHTDELTPFNYNQPTQISVTMHADELSADIQSASATVTPSSNLVVQSVTPGDCNMNFTKAPSVSDLSFSGTIPNNSTVSCTVFTATVLPQSLNGETASTGSVTLSNESVTSTNNQSIFAGAFNGQYNLLKSNSLVEEAAAGVWYPNAVKPGNNFGINVYFPHADVSFSASTKMDLIEPDGKTILTSWTSPVQNFTPNNNDPNFSNIFAIPASAPLGTYHTRISLISSDGSIIYLNPNAISFDVTTNGQPLPASLPAALIMPPSLVPCTNNCPTPMPSMTPCPTDMMGMSTCPSPTPTPSMSPMPSMSGTSEPGDVNEDGKVDLGDFAQLAKDFGKPVSEAGFPEENLDGDSTIDIGDISKFIIFYRQATGM